MVDAAELRMALRCTASLAWREAKRCWGELVVTHRSDRDLWRSIWGTAMIQALAVYRHAAEVKS